MNIIITGGSKGIGKAIAEKFAANQHSIYLCSRTEKKLAETALEIQEKYPTVLIKYFPSDLSSKQGAEQFGQWLLNQQIPIDVLINNAGTFIPGSIYNEEEGTLENMIENNLYSAYHLTRILLPSMMECKKGHIFNACSIASLQAYANGGSYSISKFALMGFSKNLREELKPHGIKVTAIYPGAVYTDSWAGTGIDPARVMEAKDIAELIFLASSLSPQACVEDIVIRPQLGDLP